MKYYTNYPTEPIGGKNPYYRCSFCGVSVTQANGDLNGHYDFCEWANNEKNKNSFRDLILKWKEDCKYNSSMTLEINEYCRNQLDEILIHED